MTATEEMREFLRGMGCRRNRNLAHCHPATEWWILDAFDSNMYLGFDLTNNEDRPGTWGTVDIFACRPGESVHESKERIELVDECTITNVMQFMLGMGIDRFSAKTRGFLKEQLGA